MATIIKASCPQCGEVRLEPAWIRLLVAHKSCYRFQCPECGDTVTKEADSEVISLLMVGGIEPESIPGELLEPRVGPTITYDDVLDFALALRDM